MKTWFILGLIKISDQPEIILKGLLKEDTSDSSEPKGYLKVDVLSCCSIACWTFIRGLPPDVFIPRYCKIALFSESGTLGRRRCGILGKGEGASSKGLLKKEQILPQTRKGGVRDLGLQSSFRNGCPGWFGCPNLGNNLRPRVRRRANGGALSAGGKNKI